ncbi:MAG TPA: choice-of-anchor B family protein [Anaerolineales bacterium]|nr:choice-of-anchor B family protein [Anaerolineales bacterium]
MQVNGISAEETPEPGESAYLDWVERLIKEAAPGENPPSANTLPCNGGFAGIYPCWRVDLKAFMPLDTFSAGNANDLWGWTDPLYGKEYALLGLNNGTAFVDITDTENPVYLGNLPTHSITSIWRDIKVFSNYAFIVADNAGSHGLQVFDLVQLRSVVNPPVTFTETAHYGNFTEAHNIAINEDTGYAYILGSNTCSGGLHIVNIQNPLNPTFAGCFSNDGYTHDAQCEFYHGPDTDYSDHEMCFNANGDTLTIVDVTNKAAPVAVSITPYAGSGFTHQGWLTEDHAYFLLGDETDEISFGHNTRTRIWNVANLDAPVVIGIHDGPNPSTDHNLYVRDQFVFESNYTSGLQIYDLCEVSNGILTLAAYFDSYPANNNTGYFGSWSNYPYFASGNVLVSGIYDGLFILKPLMPGVSLSPKASYLSGTSGEVISHTFWVSNMGTISDTFGISVDGNSWNTSLSLASSNLLAPGEIFTVTVGVTIPLITALADIDIDEFTLTVSSGANSCITAQATGKTHANVNPGVVLTPAHQVQSGFPGETVFHSLTITNTGDYTDTFTYSVNAIWPTAVHTTTTNTLPPGEQTTLLVGVQTPGRKGGVIAATDIFTLTAISQWDMTITEQASGTTQVVATPGVVLSPVQTGMGSIGSNVTYTLVVTNTGNFADTFLIEASGVWPTTVSPSETSPLGFGESFSFSVAVHIPASAVIDDSDTTTVTATSSLDTSVNATVEIKTVVPHQLFFPLIVRNE